MDLQPTLKGLKVSLKPLQAKHFDELYQVASDPLIWELHQCKDRYKLKEFKVYFEDAINSGAALVVEDVQNNKLIGSSRFKILLDIPDAIEIGWSFLARAYWGGSYNGEIKRLMIDHAFTFCDIIIFYIDHKNLRSQKAVLKLGAMFADQAKYDYLHHQDENNLSYVIHKDDWI